MFSDTKARAELTSLLNKTYTLDNDMAKNLLISEGDKTQIDIFYFYL